MEIIVVLVIVALFILYAIGRSASEADEQSDAMAEAMQREREDAEAYRRITSR